MLNPSKTLATLILFLGLLAAPLTLLAAPAAPTTQWLHDVIYEQYKDGHTGVVTVVKFESVKQASVAVTGTPDEVDRYGCRPGKKDTIHVFKVRYYIAHSLTDGSFPDHLFHQEAVYVVITDEVGDFKAHTMPNTWKDLEPMKNPPSSHGNPTLP